ncbi:MAG: response regulator [Verrucomicrobia bacterium]|nr:response regulator [Verrucomicrobiota bacterium]
MAPQIPIPLTFWLIRFQIGLASTVIALGVAVLVGWILQITSLVQWGETWAPVPANAAVCFALIGALLLAIEFGYRRAALLAIVPLALSLLTELQNHFPLRVPLDELFATDYLQIETSAPGRMPAALSWCFIIGGLTLPLHALCKRASYRSLGLAFGGSALMAVGGSTVLGYVLGLPAVYRWGGTSSMPPGAAVLLFLLGAAFLLLAWREHRSTQPGAPAWLPMPVVVASTTLTVILWIGLHERENIYLGNTTQATMNGLASTINFELERQVASLERYARQWSQTTPSPVIWETDARMMLNDSPGCTAILWITPECRTIWAYPSRGNEALNALNHETESARHAALDAALQTRAAAMSASLAVHTQGRGFVIYCPVFRGTELVGYAGSEYTYQRFFNAIDRKLKLADNYHYSLSIAGDPVFTTDTDANITTSNRLESVFSIFDRRLRIEISPSAENLISNRRPLPEVALLAGLGITALLGLSIHLARAARTSLRTARHTNLQLLAENDERRRIEAMLKVSDEQLRLALDSTQIGIFEWNLTVNQLYYSSGVWTMLGYLPGVIPPTPEAWTSLIHSEDLPIYRTAVEQQLKGTLLFIEPEYRVLSANGEWLWIYARSRSVNLSPSGAPLRIIGTLQDITARKQSEEALRISQATTRKLSLVASKTDNLVIIARPDGTIDWVNESFERVMEYPLAEISGRNPGTFMIGPETSARTIRRIKIAGRNGEVISTDIVNYSKSGKKYHLQLEIQPVRNEAGVLENFIGILADITARVETEHNLRRAKAEADAASRAKSDFLASMSHEIRTPMNGVIGMTSLLLDTKLNHDQRDFVSTIRTSGEALLTIINDILDFSKIESGKMELEHLPFDLSVCVEEALDLFSLAAAAKKVELAYHLDDAVPGWIMGDVTRLRQILVNLVNNAVKFTPAGRISIIVTRIGAPNTTPSRACPVTLELAVHDSGIGIPPDRMNRLFRPFSQVDSSTTRKYGGTGLGLAICHRLCGLMGEGISVASTPGQGSIFKFSVRTESVPTPPDWGLPEMPVKLNYGPILCLEDNPVTQQRLETFFRTWGARATCSPTLAAAEDFLAGEIKPSALIVDSEIVQSPEAAGFLEKIKQREVPTLFLLPSAQSKPTGLPREPYTTTIAKPLRTLSLVRGMQAIFNAIPDSLPPFAYAPEQRQLAHEIPLDVLLVEDNPVNQKVALRFLDRLGYRADAVANGLEAVATLEARRYDLVLMDLQMPEMDGFEASRQIRSRIPLELQPRIIALTANALSGDRELCLAAGMNDYIAKPVKMHEIADAIRRQFSGSRPPFSARK